MKTRIFLFLFFLLAHPLCFAQENGFSYWWQSDGIFEEQKKKGKKIWKLNLSGGANLDSNGNLKNRFAKASGKVWDISGEVRVKEGDDVKGNAALRHGIFYAKGGDLTSKHRGALSELNLSGLHLGGEWLFREERDSSWVYGKFSKNFLEKPNSISFRSFTE